MPERSLFDLRYAAPGYTFILIILLINLRSITKTSMAPEIIATLIAFLALSGGAVGVIISQIWYAIYNKCSLGTYKTFLDSAKLIEQEWNRHRGRPVDPYKCKMDREWVVTIRDRLTHHPKEPIIDYITRRWDLYHLLRSISCAIAIGLTTGYLTKLLAFHECLSCDYDDLISLVIVFIAFICWGNSKNPIKESDRMAQLVIWENMCYLRSLLKGTSGSNDEQKLKREDAYSQT